MGRPKEHNAEMRGALLAAAERLIESDGPDAASVRAVADSVGATTRAVYSVFGSKDGMLAALATRLFELLAEAVDGCEATGDPVNDVVTISLDGFRRTALEHPALYGLVFLRQAGNVQFGPEFVRAGGDAFGRLESHLAVLDARGELGSTPVRSAAQSVHALTEGLASMELRGMISAESGAEQIWRTSVQALVTGFGIDKPRRGRR
jgi:AcrR family transcriptional regulator